MQHANKKKKNLVAQLLLVLLKQKKKYSFKKIIEIKIFFIFRLIRLNISNIIFKHRSKKIMKYG